ncbi:hypothetical protein K443DRAFT_680828 [Laccaria amethystina LaAM-08-1]|uniref:Uncharacterized protein n=1 Tax=Laccaria amethystina LaAM-08-1 TaxID=1095629 RepID=A0A0C9WZU0_9AGAR|nr:hypothetical protein K443DRAFT_680828 [Laccaria amethystina LaAM-08-1]
MARFGIFETSLAELLQAPGRSYQTNNQGHLNHPFQAPNPQDSNFEPGLVGQQKAPGTKVPM